MLGSCARICGVVVAGVVLAGAAGSCSSERAASDAAEGAAPDKALSAAAPVEASAAPSEPAPKKGEVLDQEAAIPIARIGERREGGAIALGTMGGKRVAFIADEDDKAVRAVDLATRGEIARAPLGGRPGQVLITPDGRLAVALRDGAAVVLLEATATPSLREAARMPAATEPLGLALTPDGETLLVTSGWGRKLAALSLSSGSSLFAVDLPREPRAVLVTDDGARAYVSHALGSAISVVSLAGEEHGVGAVKLGGEDYSMEAMGCLMRHSAHRRAAVQGYALASIDRRIFAPSVVVHQDAEQGMTGGYGGDGEAFLPEEPSLVVIEDPATKAQIRIRSTAFNAGASETRSGFNQPFQERAPCLLPRAAAVNPDRSSLLVTCLGTDIVIEMGSKASGAASGLAETEIARWKVPSGPMGIAVDASSKQAFVWSQLARSLSVIDLGRVKPPRRGAPILTPPPLASDMVLSSPPVFDASFELGRKLFHAVGDRRISADGRVCASCHPDGREDGIVWSSPGGARQTPMLAGRLASSAPYGWSGDTPTIAAHLAHTFKRLGGKGLKGAELDALVAYATAMPGPPTTPSAERPLDAVAARGRELFTSQDTGCSVCHTDGGSGSDGSRHDVGSGAPLDTPTLRFIAGTAPYFHDGRYATLGELLRATKGKMGWANGLTDDDFNAIEVYLATL